MNSLPTAIRTLRGMVRDTFRQSLYTKLFWVMLGITGVCTLFCLSVSIDSPPRRSGHPDELPIYLPANHPDPEADRDGIRRATGMLSIGFGMFRVPIVKNAEDSVRLIQLMLAGVLADNAGVLLALLWTAGFLPTFLEPQAITVLLAKPVPRWAILLGKYLGVVLFVTLQAILFVLGTWIGLGVGTGVWDATYWFAVPILVCHFAAFYAFSAATAVVTRSTVVSVFGTLLFWLLCWTMNVTHHQLIANPPPEMSTASGFLLKAGYWVLPKPLDFSRIFFEAMRAQDHSIEIQEIDRFFGKGHFMPELSVLASLLFAAGILALAAYEFRHMDY